MGLFWKKKKDVTIYAEDFSRMEPFAKALETELGEKFHRNLIENEIPIFESESRIIGLLVSDVKSFIKRFGLEVEFKASALQKRMIHNTEAIGIEGYAWIDFSIYKRLIDALEKMNIKDYTILMAKAVYTRLGVAPRPVVILTPKFHIVIAPILE